jgi:hypothetical protein
MNLWSFKFTLSAGLATFGYGLIFLGLVGLGIGGMGECSNQCAVYASTLPTSTGLVCDCQFMFMIPLVAAFMIFILLIGFIEWIGGFYFE